MSSGVQGVMGVHGVVGMGSRGGGLRWESSE